MYYLINCFYITGFIYAWFMLFSINSENKFLQIKPLGREVRTIEPILFFQRRLYAIEFWLIFSSCIMFNQLYMLNYHMVNLNGFTAKAYIYS